MHSRLIPILLNHMIFEDDDIMVLRQDEEAVEERPENIRPLFYRAKTHATASEAEGQENDETDGEDDEDDPDDGQDDAEVSEWNVRKCAAAGLDMLAGIHGAQILPLAFPELQARIQSQDWKVREAAILALGALAEGCQQELAPYLPDLCQYLLGRIDSDQKVLLLFLTLFADFCVCLQPLIRGMACWSLSRFSDTLVGEALTLERILMSFLNAMVDRKKCVQGAACSAFANVVEQAKGRIVPFLMPILTHAARAFSMYKARPLLINIIAQRLLTFVCFSCPQDRNLLILYDAMSSVAQVSGSALNRPEYIDVIMPPLTTKWSVIPDGDESLFPLIEVNESPGVGDFLLIFILSSESISWHF